MYDALNCEIDISFFSFSIKYDATEFLKVSGIFDSAIFCCCKVNLTNASLFFFSIIE